MREGGAERGGGGMREEKAGTVTSFQACTVMLFNAASVTVMASLGSAYFITRSKLGRYKNAPYT